MFYTVHSFQDGLRALLPNVNVSFGVGGSGGNVGNPGAGAGQGHFGLGGMHQQQQSAFSQQQDRQQTLQHNTSMDTYCTAAIHWRF